MFTSALPALLLLGLMGSVTSGCLPDMSSFSFGACPNMTADSDDASIYDGRWYVLRSTAAFFWPPKCTVVDVEETNSTSAPLQLNYSYQRGRRTKTKQLDLLTSDNNGTYYVQKSGLGALLGREQLVADVITDDLTSVLTCQPLLFGHLFSAQVWSRSSAEPAAADLSAALQRLGQRGVRLRKVRTVDRTNCPDDDGTDDVAGGVEP